MQRLAIGLLFAAALAAVLFFALDLGGDRAGDTADRAFEDPLDESTPATLQGRGATTRPGTHSDDGVGIRGSVEDESGRAVGGVLVEVRHGGAPADDADVVESVRSGADGTFVLTRVHPHDGYVVRAVPDPPAVGESFHHSSRAKPPTRVVLRVWRGTPLQLRVVDERGEGLAAFVSGRSRSPSSRLLSGVHWSFDERSTDGEGRLHVAAAPPGRLALDVRVPGRGARRDVAVLHPADGEVVISFGAGGRAAVVGRVEDEAGRAVQGAEVVLVVRPGSLSAVGAVREERVAEAGAEGHWRVDGLPAGILGQLTVRAPGHVLADRRGANLLLSPEEETRVDVTLRRGVTFKGRVTTQDGTPLQGVRVLVHGPNQAWKLLALPSDGTDALGRFRVEDAPPGLVAVSPWSVQASGYYLPDGLTWDLATAGGDEEHVVVLRRGVTIGGRVVDAEDGPVAGVTVVARGPSMRRAEPLPKLVPRTTSDEEGRFAFEGLDATGGWSLGVTGDEWVAEPPNPWVHPQAKGWTPEDVWLRVGRAASVRGRVVDDGGAPVARYRVKLEVRSSWWSAVTDGTGCFTFARVPAGPAWIGPMQDGAAPDVEPVELDVAWGQRVDDVTLRVRKTFLVRGRVVDSSQRPVAGLRVSIRPEEESSKRRWSTFTDAGGSFECADLPAGAYRASLGGAQGATPFQAGDLDVLIVYDAPPPVVLEGRVSLPGGGPVPLGRVRLDGGGLGSAAILDGRFCVPIRGRPWRVGVAVTQATDRLGASLDLCAPPRSSVDPSAGRVEIVMAPGLPLVGRVLDASGSGARGVRLELEGVKGMLAPRSRVTDADGRFGFTGVPAGKATLEVDGGHLWPDPLPADVEAGATDVVVRLEAGGVLEGVVVGSDGRPVAGATASTWWHTKTLPRKHRFEVTDRQGRFRIEGVPLLPVSVSVGPPTGATRTSWPWLPAQLGGKVTPPRRDLRFVLEPGARIAGTVVDSEGRPVRDDVEVIAVAVDGASYVKKQGRPNSGDDRFSIEALPHGTYSVRARASSDTLGVSDAVVVRAPADDVRLVVEARWAVTGRLWGTDVEGFVVEFFREGAGASSKSARVEASGHFAIEGLSDPGRGAVYAHRDGDDRVAFLERADPKRDAGLSLWPGRAIRGRIEADPPVATGSLVVEARDERGIGGTGVVREDATFDVAGLPHGPSYRLRVTSGLPPGARASEVEDVQAGAENVVLRVE